MFYLSSNIWEKSAGVKDKKPFLCMMINIEQHGKFHSKPRKKYF